MRLRLDATVDDVPRFGGGPGCSCGVTTTALRLPGEWRRPCLRAVEQGRLARAAPEDGLGVHAVPLNACVRLRDTDRGGLRRGLLVARAAPLTSERTRRLEAGGQPVMPSAFSGLQ